MRTPPHAVTYLVPGDAFYDDSCGDTFCPRTTCVHHGVSSPKTSGCNRSFAIGHSVYYLTTRATVEILTLAKTFSELDSVH